jgi:hypothetical protein
MFKLFNYRSLADTKSLARLYVYLRALITLKPKTIAHS